jgi:hypothetical protein
MHAKSVRFVNYALLAAAAFGLALLPGGCVGVPQTFYAAEPAAPERPVLPRLSPRPAPASVAPTLSDSEKRRLFQDFQQSQSVKDQATTTQELVP